MCYTCREPGHKSPDCPNKLKSESAENKYEPGKKLNLKKIGRTYNTNWVAVREKSPYVEGFVNGTKCQIVPDTGAEITIVPGCFVYEHQLRDEKVRVRGWKGVPEWLHTAVVDFEFQGKKFQSVVAVAREDMLCGRVLYSVPMDDSMAAKLLLDAASESVSLDSGAGQLRDTRNVQTSTSVDAGSVEGSVGALVTPLSPESIPEEIKVNVVTRSASKKAKVAKIASERIGVCEANPSSFRDEFERLSLINVTCDDVGSVDRSAYVSGLRDVSPDSQGVDGFVGADGSVGNVDGSVGNVDGSVGNVDGSVGNVDGSVGNVVSDGNDVSVSNDVSVDRDVSCSSPVVESVVDGDVSSSIVSVDASNSEGVIVDLQSVHECDDLDNVALDVCGSLDVPVLKEEAGRDVLKKEMLVDESLKACRDLADRKLNGYSWRDCVLIHSIVDIDNSVVDRIVLPVGRRCHAMSLAHDKSAHVGVRGMRRLLGKRFTWPGLHADITSFIRSCDKCLRYNSAGNKKAKMVERGIVTVPFETVAVDLVGPLPKGRQGVKYLFTYICLASRWPEAQPMRTAAAKEAAQCFLDIIACTGIPLKVLSDRVVSSSAN